jgi:hypothetical protein
MINVEPSCLRVSPGDEFTVNITVDPNGAEVYGAQYELSFDNSLLMALSQTNGSFLSQDGAGTSVFMNGIDNVTGMVKYGKSITGATSGVTNPGVLATITFQAIAGHEGVSELRFDSVKMSDPLAKPIPINDNDGNVEISSSYNFNGFPVTTRTNGTVHGGVFIDYEPWAGSETLNGAFDVPNGDIKWAYLYTGIWGGTERYEGWVNVTFSGDSTNNNLGPIWLRGQNDTNPNVWCSGHGKHWMYYNVTNLTNAGSTNIATVSKINATDPAGNFDGRVYGIVLVVVYEGGDNPKDLRYWINDGSDALNYVYDHDAGTTYFNGTVDTDKVSKANLTMVHLTAYDPEVGDGLKFNGNTQDTSMVVNDDFELNTWDVTNHIASSGNDAWYTRCGVYPACSDLDSDKYINICNAILVLDETPSQPPQPDLNVTAIGLNPDYDAPHRELFANESNTINATITNIDTNNNSNAFNVSFEIAGVNTWEVRVNGLAAGASTDVSINWTPASGGTLLSPVNYNLDVTADCDGEVSETNENNNASTKTLTVYNNGYKGKRYTGGSDVETEQMDTINGNLVYSKGNSTYQSGGNFWDSYTVQWTSGDFSIPVTATVKKARLYVYYCWDSSDTGINASMNFNEQVFSMDDLDAHYKDVKGYASYHNHKSGTMTYNVTDYFNTGSNVATFTKVGQYKKIAIFGMVLVVVYEDANEPQRLIWINEECDILDALGEGSSTTGYIGVNETEATAYAPFSGTMDISKVAAAALITIAPAGDSGSGNEDRLYFNTGQWDNVWNGAQGKDVSIEETDVKSHLQSDNNVARIQSRGDYMTATNAFLVVEYEEIVETYTIDGYIFNGGTPPTDPKVNVTNLDNGKEWAASIDGNFYNLSLILGVDVNASETLQIVACEELPDHESNCNVTDITATIPGGDHNVNLTLNHYCLNYYPDYPYYTKEQDNWSGPAVMQACIGHYYDLGDVPSQALLNETGIANNTACNADLQYVDPFGMKETLNHNWMWPIGRNYGLYSRANTTEGLNDMLHYTCYWQHLGPAPVPAYGDYSNWMVVRGIHTSEDPYHQSAGSYDIYGFWINDPNDGPESIGENTYKTVDQWTEEYYLELSGVRDCDDYRYKYVALFEPPKQPAREVRAVHAKPRFDKTITPVMMENTFMAYGIEQKALERTVKDDETLKIVKAAIDGVTEELIPYDAEFAEIFAKTVPGKPMLVSSDNGDYYVVPFNVPVKERPQVKKRRHVAKPRPIMPIKVERTLVVVLVDAEDGSFKEASWVADPAKYLPVAKTEALKLALGELHAELHIVAKKDAKDLEIIEQKPTIELVYRDSSPYYPAWKITVNERVFYVSQDGTVSCDEPLPTPTLTPRPIKPGPIRILPI